MLAKITKLVLWVIGWTMFVGLIFLCQWVSSAKNMTELP